MGSSRSDHQQRQPKPTPFGNLVPQTQPKVTSKALIICGPTATGKTKLAIKLAKKFKGEIISADSRQVYRGMDVGTGKNISSPTFHLSNLSWQKKKLGYFQDSGIKIWGYDLADPNQMFSIALYNQITSIIIADIISRKKLPIIVGGTGLYIQSIVDPPATLSIPRNESLRVKLSKLKKIDLQLQLKIINTKRYKQLNASDINNPRRLIRAIEVATYRQKHDKHISFKHSQNPTNHLWIGLNAPMKMLESNILENVVHRSKYMTGELKKLKTNNFNWRSQAATASGYTHWQQHLDGKITRKKAIELWSRSEIQYLKRQLTWFKRIKEIHWFDITKSNFRQSVEDLVKPWYSSY